MALSDYDDAADNVAPGGKAGFSSLPDGKYAFTIEGAELKETRNGTDLFKMTLLGLEGPASGKQFEQDYWLTSVDKSTGQKSLNDVKVGILKKDLENLGFDVAEWTKANGRPLSKELPKAILLLQGMNLNGEKTTNKSYANFKIVGRGQPDGKPEKIGPAELEAAAKANEDPFE